MQKDKPAQWKRTAARNYFIKNPDASISEAAQATQLSIRTCATARKQLADEGILPSGRNSEPFPDLPSPSVETEAPAAPEKPGRNRNSLLDSKALQDLSNMLDNIEAIEDDAEAQKLMLRQVKRMSFDLSLHPDTRMSAMQMWGKLRDMTAARVLGPGKPLNEEAALERLCLLMEAVGANLIMKALYRVFKIGETNGSTETDNSAPAGPPTETPSTT